MTAAAMDRRTMLTDARKRLRCLETANYAMLSTPYEQTGRRRAELQIPERPKTRRQTYDRTIGTRGVCRIVVK